MTRGRGAGDEAVGIERAIAGPVATITLTGGPTARLGDATLRRLAEAIDSPGDGVGAILVRGSGLGGGADVDGWASDPREATAAALATHESLSRIEQSDRPVACALSVSVTGPGLAVALACHLRVAAEGARLGVASCGPDRPPTPGTVARLARTVGRTHALELMLTAEPVSAERAAAIGLVGAVVPGPHLDAACHRLLTAIARRPPAVVRLILESVRHGLDLASEDAAVLEAALFGLCRATADPG